MIIGSTRIAIVSDRAGVAFINISFYDFFHPLHVVSFSFMKQPLHRYPVGYRTPEKYDQNASCQMLV
jgi:hypothetical protein